MKTLKLIFILLFTLSFGCTKEEEKEILQEDNLSSEIFFSLNIDDNYISDNSLGNWLIIHDKNGNILDYTKYKNGDKLSFEAQKDSIIDNIHITILNSFSHTPGGKKNYLLKTYPNIPKKSIWNFKSTIPSDNALIKNPVVGKFNIKVDNIPEVKIHTLSVDNSIISNNAKITTSDSNPENHQINIDGIDLHERNTYFLSILDGNNDLKYILINDVKNESNISLNYDDFKNFDSYLHIDLPSQQYLAKNPSVFAYEKEVNQTNGLYTFSHPYDSSYWYLGLNFIKIGYLNRFEKYKIRFDLSLDDFHYGYYKQGNKTNNLTIPEKPNYTYEDSSIYDFSFNASTNYIRKVSSWRYNSENSSTIWEIFSDSNTNLSFNKLPTEIINTNPEMNINSMTYSKTKLYTKSVSQIEFIDNLFVSNNKIKEYEIEYISLRKK